MSTENAGAPLSDDELSRRGGYPAGELRRRLGLSPAPVETRPKAVDRLVGAVARVLQAPAHHLRDVTLIRVPAASWLALRDAAERVDEERRGPRRPEVT